MKVLLIGKTQVDLFPFQGDSTHHMPGLASGSKFEERVRKTNDRVMGRGETPEELIEFAGRLCYESWDLPNPDTATNEGYISNILEKEHFSIFEHASVTFYVDGVSRNLSHELIRHRHLSFSELSQRYVNMSDANVVMPPAYREVEPDLPEKGKLRPDLVAEYNHNVSLLEESGIKGKKARQAARYGLPSAMETKFVVSGNLRAWRDILPKRLSQQADAEMQQFAKKVWEILSAEYPNTFADIEDQ